LNICLVGNKVVVTFEDGNQINCSPFEFLLIDSSFISDFSLDNGASVKIGTGVHNARIKEIGEAAINEKFVSYFNSKNQLDGDKRALFSDYATNDIALIENTFNYLITALTNVDADAPDIFATLPVNLDIVATDAFPHHKGCKPFIIQVQDEHGKYAPGCLYKPRSGALENLIFRYTRRFT